MKSIKHLFLTIYIFGSLVANAQQMYHEYYNYPIFEWLYANYSTATTPTPKCNPVSVYNWNSNDWTPGTKTDMISYYQNQYGGRLTFESEGTVKYNCHAWAWGGLTLSWMNYPSQVLYWNDGSYTQVYTPSAGTKVWYGGAKYPYDHSAIVVSSTKFSSKWGSAPRFTHNIDDSPYDVSQLKYYQLSPPPLFYVSIGSGYCLHSTINVGSSGGYASRSLYAYASQSNPNSYVWSASWSGQCANWSMTPVGNRADCNVTLNSGQSGGTLSVTCDMYNGGTFLGTATHLLNVYP